MSFFDNIVGFFKGFAKANKGESVAKVKEQTIKKVRGSKAPLASSFKNKDTLSLLQKPSAIQKPSVNRINNSSKNNYKTVMFKHDRAVDKARDSRNTYTYRSPEAAEYINNSDKMKGMNWNGTIAANIKLPTGGTLADKMRGQENYHRLQLGVGVSRETQRLQEQLDELYSGKWNYNTTQEEYDKWEKENLVEKTFYNPKTGKREVELNNDGTPKMVFKIGAELPPTGCDANGKKPDRAALKKAWDAYLATNNYVEQTAMHETWKQGKMAGTDVNASDSLVEALQEDMSGKDFNTSYLMEYVRDYFWRPLKSGNYGTLLINQLNNLDEVTDLFGRGTRAIFASGELVYGQKGSFKGADNFWVSSLGKKKQKALIKAGAMDLLKEDKSHSSESGHLDSLDFTSAESKRKAALKKLKDAGLYEEFLQFKKEYEEHDFNGTPLKNLGKAYTTNEKYAADTGNVWGDMAVEMILDPSLVVGGLARGASKTGTKAVTKLGLRTGLEAVKKNSDEVAKFFDSNDKVTKRYLKTLGEHLYSANSDIIKQDLSNYADALVRNKVIKRKDKVLFTTIAEQEVQKQIDTKTFKIVKSLHNLDKGIDVVDSALLKASFAVPYTTFKAGQGIYKTTRKQMAKAGVAEKRAFEKTQAAARIWKDMLDEEGNTSVGNLDEVMNRLEEDYVTYEDDGELISDTFGKFEEQSKKDAAEMEKLIYSMQHGDVLFYELEESVNDFIRKATKEKCATKAEFKNYLADKYDKYVDYFEGSMQKIYSLYFTQLERLEQAAETARKNAKSNAVNALLSASSLDEFEEMEANIWDLFQDDEKLQKVFLVKKANLATAAQTKNPTVFNLALRKYCLRANVPLKQEYFGKKPLKNLFMADLLEATNLEELEAIKKTHPKLLYNKDVKKLYKTRKAYLKAITSYTNFKFATQTLDTYVRTAHLAEGLDKIIDKYALFKKYSNEEFRQFREVAYYELLYYGYWKQAPYGRAFSRAILENSKWFEKEFDNIFVFFEELLSARSLEDLESVRKHYYDFYGIRGQEKGTLKVNTSRLEDLKNYSLYSDMQEAYYLKKLLLLQEELEDFRKTFGLVSGQNISVTPETIIKEGKAHSAVEHTVITKPYTDDVLVGEGYKLGMTPAVLEKAVHDLDTLNKQYTARLSRGLDNFDNIGEDLAVYLNKFRTSANEIVIRDMDLYELRELINTDLNKLLYKKLMLAYADSLSAVKNLQQKAPFHEKLDDDYEVALRKFKNILVQDFYTAALGKDEQIIRTQNDILSVFDHWITDKDFQKVIKAVVDPKNPLGALLSKAESVHFGSENHELASIVDCASRLEQQVDLLNEYWALRANLEPKFSGLSQKQMYALLDKAFGITLGKPSRYAAGRDIDDFLYQTELSLNALYGESKVSLDGFRKSALDFQSDLYKDYADEMQDPQIQTRLRKVLSGGHLDSRDDVRVQILQLVLKDKETVKLFNELSKKQAVLIMDLETFGLNKELNPISSIAYKQWHPLSEEASLSEILDFIEEDMNYHQIYVSEEVLDYTISDELLMVNCQGMPDVIKTRESMLEVYKSKFGAQRNNKSVSEKDILSAFIYELDTFYLKADNKTPVIVTHNNNDFDMKFFSGRVKRMAEFPAHIVHLQDLIDESMNTFSQIKTLENDELIFTAEQRAFIRDTFRPIFEKMSRSGYRLEFLDPEYIEKLLLTLEHNLHNYKITLTELTSKEVYLKNESFNNAVLALEDVVFEQFLEMFKKASYNIFEENKIFKNNIIFKPDYSNSAVINNLLKESMKVNPSANIPVLGYEILADEKQFLRYFEDVGAYFENGFFNRQVSVEVYTAMQSFVKDVNRTLRYQLKENDLLIDYFDELKELIKAVKVYARSVFGQDFFKTKSRDTALSFNWGNMHPYFYLCFLKEPDTVEEAYVVARKLYDDFLSWTDRTLFTTLFEKSGYAKEYSDLSIKSQKSILFRDFDNLKYDKGRQGQSDMLRSLVFDNKPFRNLLRGVYDGEIYRNTANRYVDKLKTPLVDKAFDLYKERAKANSCIKKMTTYESLMEDLKIEDVKDYRIRETYEEWLSLLNEMEDKWTTEISQKYEDWAKNIMSKRREVMTAQIMRFITDSEENLVNHLLFHNQLLVIPRKGSALHMHQVDDLLKLLSGNLRYIEWVEDNGYIFIGLNKDVRMYIRDDSRFTTEKVTMRINNNNKIFSAPEYDDIPWFFEDNTIEGVPEDIRVYVQKTIDVSKKIDVLTEGASRGSVGVLHNLDKQKKFYKTLPKHFAEKILSDEFTCDARLWHQGSFDMSNLGDSEHCWKLDGTDDTDVLYMMSRSLEEAAGKASSERSYLEHFFGKYSSSRMSNMLSSLKTAQDKVAFLKKNSDQVVVTVQANEKTSSGFEVKVLNITDEYSVQYAEAANAIIVPYEVYLDMVSVLNNATIKNSVLKVWAKINALTKAGQLFKLSTLLNNYVDATIKSINDTGEVTSVVAGQVKAIKLYTDFNRVAKFIDKERSVTYKSEKDIERMFRKGLVQSSLGIDMTYEQFHWMEGIMQESVMSGKSFLSMSLEKINKISVSKNLGLKIGRTDTASERKVTKEAYDLIASDTKRFVDLGISEIKNYCDNLPFNIFKENGFTRETFIEACMKLKNGIDDMSDEVYQHFAEIQNEIIKQRSKKFVGLQDRSNFIVDKICAGLYFPSTYLERIIRLGEYIALEEQGYTRSAIFKKITDSQFNNTLKTNPSKIIELVIPYYNFEKLNLVYWCKQLSENPRMLRYIEHVWGELTWESAFETYDEDNTVEQNQSLLASIWYGRLALGNDGLLFKMNPSYLSVMNYLFFNPNTYFGKLSVPLQYLLTDSLDSIGADAWHLFDKVNFDKANESWQEQLLSSVPLIGTIYSDYVKGHFHNEEKVWQRIKEGHSFQEALVFAFPDLFGAVKQYEQQDCDSFKAFQSNLEQQGKWYDKNQGRVVALSEKNSVALNRENLDWSELTYYMAQYHNKFWDNNKREFVPYNEFTFGGLNRDFDFKTNPDDWDEYCRLRKLYHNEDWDNNQRKFVTPDKYIEGKLNSKGLTKEEVLYYNKLFFGTQLDANQSVFVKYEDYIAGGLNKENLTWNELCAYKYALHGEQWQQGKGWVKVRSPIVQFVLPETDDTSSVSVRRNNSLLENLGLVDVVYAGNAQNAQKSSGGKYILTNNVVDNADIFAAILSEYSGVGQSSRNYYNGNAGGYRHYAASVYPSRPKFAKGVSTNQVYNKVRSTSQGVKSGGKIYSKPYNISTGLAGLRMATSGYTAYDEYYKQEYEYNYRYRNPIKDVANYPQTKLGIQRYLRGRTEKLERKLRNHLGTNVVKQSMSQNLSTKEQLRNMKLSWWNRY